MSLFWKIFASVFLLMLGLAAPASYLVSVDQIEDARQRLIEEYCLVSDLLSKQIEVGYVEAKWPFESLRDFGRRPGTLFWWVVCDEGHIHLADDAAFMGTRADQYFPHVPVQVDRQSVFLNAHRHCGLVLQPLQTAEGKWSFWVGFSTHKIAVMQRRALALNAAVALAALGGIGAILYGIVQHFTRPIGQLVRGAAALGAGDLATRVPIASRDELGGLAESFNRMASQLQRQHAQILAHSRDLERKVAERTEALHAANASLQDANRRLGELAATDELTGLWNRRRFLEALEREVRRYRRWPLPLSLVMIDVDHFKEANDTHGHTFGDRVLQHIANVLREKGRAADTAARYAGDEFVVLMPNTGADEALRAASRLHRAVGQPPAAALCPSAKITVSMGLATAEPGGAATAEGLLRLADEALYAAKQAGRNCLRTWDQVCSEPKDAPEVQAEEIESLRRRVATLSLQAKDVFVRSLQGLIHALEARDPYTRSHSDNVTCYAVGLAETMDLPPEDVAVIRRAAMVHDLGKIGIHDAILRKPTGLSPGERHIMQQHPLIGVRILDQMRFLEREIPLVRHHHERWDGKGYPDGLAGQAIPQGARILAVADAFDAITSHRVYHQARDVGDALRILLEEAGRQFDPDVVDAMVRWTARVRADLGAPATLTAETLLRAPLADLSGSAV